MAIVPKSGITIPRQSVVGSEGLWTKMYDPPTDSPPTPEQLNLTLIGLDGAVDASIGAPPGSKVRANPVASVMGAAPSPTTPGKNMLKSPPSGGPYSVRRTLLHNMNIPTWDNRAGGMIFFTFADDDLLGKDAQGNNFSMGQFPAPTVRVPRGAIFHGFTSAQGPPPHTIHWHGIEPTPVNDGVGHCSMELGAYTYQWQPNFIGTYFYHCHRNTMQHFEFGLYGLMLFHPPDAWFASIDPASVTPASRATGVITLIPGYPIGHGRPEDAVGGLPAAPTGRFRTAANLSFSGLPTFPGYIPGDPVQGVNISDPWTGNAFLKFATHPHAYTVPYDVECLWVLDDRDSNWSDNASNARATFPGAAIRPPAMWAPIPGFDPRAVTGVNDQFNLNSGNAGFFNFQDYNPDYFYVTGVGVPAPKRSTGTLGTDLIIPPDLNSGVSGSRIDIQANRGETVFIRCLDAAYCWTRVTFPVDVLIIEWDGRALGVPPLNRYTRPQLVKAGTSITHSTARRWGAILNVPLASPAVHSNVTVEFLDQRSDKLTLTNSPPPGDPDVLMTALIPININ